MFGNRFEKEYSLVEKALESEEGEKALRAHLKPLVESIVDAYSKTEGAENIERTLLYHAAFTHLSMAMRNYKRNAEKMKEGENNVYFFTTYFTWYARQGIVEYIHTKGERI